jgi:putative flippase GtrA
MKIDAKYLSFISGGVIAVSLDWSIFVFLTTQINLAFMPAKGLSFIIGMLFAFVFNGLITFGTQLSFYRFQRHLTLYCISLLLNIVVFDISMRLLSTSFDLRELTGFLAATTISMTTNFVGMRFWVFHRKVSAYE